MVKSSANTDRAWAVLEQVSDPEIPVLSVVDLGIIRGIQEVNDQLEVTISPTYSGCPAMEVIEQEVQSALEQAGFERVEIITAIHPAWTTDWMSEAGKKKLLEYGISPPEHSSDKSALTGQPKEVICPQRRSKNTRLQSQFGSTPCKSLWVCNDCREPFDRFKCI